MHLDIWNHLGVNVTDKQTDGQTMLAIARFNKYIKEYAQKSHSR